MSLTDVLIKIGGAVLFIVGIFLLLSLVGLSVFGIHAEPILAIILGVVFIAGGVALIRGQSITA